MQLSITPRPAAMTTARARASSRKTRLTPQQRQIDDALAAHGPMTVHEISNVTLLMAHEIGKRMTELQFLRRVGPLKKLDGEIVKRASPRGRASTVWTSL